MGSAAGIGGIVLIKSRHKPQHELLDEQFIGIEASAPGALRRSKLHMRGTAGNGFEPALGRLGRAGKSRGSMRAIWEPHPRTGCTFLWRRSPARPGMTAP